MTIDSALVWEQRREMQKFQGLALITKTWFKCIEKRRKSYLIHRDLNHYQMRKKPRIGRVQQLTSCLLINLGNHTHLGQGSMKSESQCTKSKTDPDLIHKSGQSLIWNQGRLMVLDQEIINSLALLKFIEEMPLVHKILLLEELLVIGLICHKIRLDPLPTVSFTLNLLNNELSTVMVMHSLKMVRKVTVEDLGKSRRILDLAATI